MYVTYEHAFNAGCDARLRGEPSTANPWFGDLANRDLCRGWRAGWLDVNQWWGAYARYPVRPLPPIRFPRETA